MLRTHEPNRDLLAGVQNYWGSGTSHLIAQYAYVNNDLALRSSVVRTGDAFDPDHHDDWVYNDRQELLSAYRWETTDPEENEDEQTFARRLYTYDAIGNRLDSTTGTTALYYCMNKLNQYEHTDNATGCTSPFLEDFSYDADGNLTAVLDEWAYTWDGENRLATATPLLVVTPRRVYTYDYRNRRVRKQAYVWDSQREVWDELPALERRYLWDGGRMVLELSNPQQTGFQPAQKYTWGLDLAGQMGGAGSLPASLEGAGTIGGLLAVHDVTVGESGADYVYAYDGQGNVGQVLDPSPETYSTAVMVAKHLYDPYGNTSTVPGYDQPFRFSTKYYDAETGWYYFGERYYMPKYGRWANQDPIGDAGGANLYAYVGNEPVSSFDPVGELCADQEAGDGQKVQGPTGTDVALGTDKPYGTCSDCEKRCHDPDAPLTYGNSGCDGPTKCYCICGNHIHNPGAEKRWPGTLEGNNIIEECVRRHEGVHYAAQECGASGAVPVAEGTNTECASDEESAKCVFDGTKKCAELTIEGTPENKMEEKRLAQRTKEKRCACLRRIQYYLEHYINCTPDRKKDGSPGPSCPMGASDKCATEKTKTVNEVAKQLKALKCEERH